MNANWQIASDRDEVYKNCNCIMFGVCFPPCWEFLMYRENKQPWIITERHQQSDLRVHLIANEMGGEREGGMFPSKTPCVGWLWVCGIFASSWNIFISVFVTI